MDNLRLLTLFSGYDSQALAMERMKQSIVGFDYDLVGWCEIDKFAIDAHNAIFPQWADRNIGDITTADYETVSDCDIATWSFPCFVSDTLVLTDSGYKKISEITTNDKVLTHTNTFKNVYKTMKHCYKGNLYTLKGMAFDELVCTEEHPFYVRKMKRVGHKQIRSFSKPEWVKAKDLQKGYYLGYAINQKSEIPKWNGTTINYWGRLKNENTLTPKLTDKNFWYVMGRYIGDGWKRKNKNSKGIIICCVEKDKETLIQSIEKLGWTYTLVKERTVNKIHICKKELYEFVERYGYMAHGKRIDEETMNLPTDLLESFIDGYMDSDGYIQNKLHRISSISRELIYGISQCVAKVYHRPFSIYKHKRKPKVIIEGRECNQHDSYAIHYKKTNDIQDKAFYEDGYIWFPINDIKYKYEEVDVFNMSVENDESYTANGVIVHNCTDISTAGRQEGLEKDSNTRSSLGWAAIELFRVKKPKILVMENVKALVSGKFMPSFQKMIDALSEIGYYSYFKVLNSKDYGVPQSRERVFMVSVLNDDTKFQFPEPFTLETRVRDLLEDEVDESYMLVDSQINCVLNTFDKDKAQLDGPKIIKLANCFPSGHAAGKVISVNGISPTIMDHHGSVYSVLLKTPVGGEYNIVLDGEYYTLRRLTRRECFRFMDVDDTYIDKMQEYGIPKSKQYKLAGNSIVVNVLYHLFKSIVSQYFS